MAVTHIKEFVVDVHIDSGDPIKMRIRLEEGIVRFSGERFLPFYLDIADFEEVAQEIMSDNFGY